MVINVLSAEMNEAREIANKLFGITPNNACSMEGSMQGSMEGFTVE
jgi:hypothetical protein